MASSSAVPLPVQVPGVGDRTAVMDEQHDRQTLGETIKARRLELGWSQEVLARRMVDHGDATFRQSDVSRLERGKVGLPHRERLGHLAAVLGLSLGEILARSGWSGWRDRSAEAIVPADAEVPGDAPVVALTARDPGEWTGWEEPARGAARLREALAQSQRTIARSEQVLKQAKVLQATFEQPDPGRRARAARSQDAGESRAGERSRNRGDDQSHGSTARLPDSSTLRQ
jgi:transcriptional regulator with XRE-family HTH domain